MPLDSQTPQTSPESGIAQDQTKYIDLVLRPIPENLPADNIHASSALAQTLGYGDLQDQVNGTSDWSKLCLQPVLSHNFSARILMRPKTKGIHIGSYKTNMEFGQWARVRVEGQPDRAEVLVVEPNHVHIGCVILYNDTRCHLFFDPGHDHLCFRNDCSTPLSTRQLDGDNSYHVFPKGRATLGVGVWALATDSEIFMEIEVLKRKTWRITQTLSSKREAPTDEGPSKRLRVTSSQAIAPIRDTGLDRRPQSVPGNNALAELQRGEVIFVGVSKMYWLKRLDTIYEQPNSTVWRAESNKHNTQLNGEKIVVKVIKPNSFGGDVIRCAEAWKNECETHAVLGNHHAIVRLLGFDARFHSIYTEHIDAKALWNHCQPDFSFNGSRADVQKIMQDIASALSHVHSKQKVHNDIKPGNILYSPERGAVLIDFGVSTTPGKPSSTGGTPWYLPPEFMRNWTLRGPASDVWALGVVSLWLLGHIPLPEATYPEWLIADISSEETTSVRHLEAIYTMNDWLDYVKEARSKLREENELEAIVKLTLDTDHTTRIDAVSLNERLGQLDLTAP
ncbi:kinase-like domain-containing protein [Xylaria scruposa]|nr:kinase-like domain-containing protein [Xylaria scruposa]